MEVFKPFFLFAVAFLAAVAIFIGTVVMLTSLQNGAISWSYGSGAKAMAETVTRAADGARFWRLFATLGALPAVIGAAVMWFSVSKLKGA